VKAPGREPLCLSLTLGEKAHLSDASLIARTGYWYQARTVKSSGTMYWSLYGVYSLWDDLQNGWSAVARAYL
jgi:hypothetical protein